MDASEAAAGARAEAVGTLAYMAREQRRGEISTWAIPIRRVMCTRRTTLVACEARR